MRFIEEALTEIGRESGFSVSCDQHGWLITLERGEQRHRIFGYIWDLNPAAAVAVAQDKVATAGVLQAAAVPAVPHEIVFNPQRRRGWSAPSGEIDRLRGFAEAWGWPLVVKTVRGSGGRGVHRVNDPIELERIVGALFATELAVALSPWIAIGSEIRAVLLGGTVMLAYRKEPPQVEGDGRRTLMELMVARVASGTLGESWLKELVEERRDARWRTVPVAGEPVALSWKHNLASGAVPEETTLWDEAHDIACAAAQAVGLDFCAVDLVVEAGGGKCRVLEINAGVMLEKLGRFSPAWRERALEIYAAAAARALA